MTIRGYISKSLWGDVTKPTSAINIFPGYLQTSYSLITKIILGSLKGF